MAGDRAIVDIGSWRQIQTQLAVAADRHQDGDTELVDRKRVPEEVLVRDRHRYLAGAGGQRLCRIGRVVDVELKRPGPSRQRIASEKRFAGRSKDKDGQPDPGHSPKTIA